MRTSLNCVLQTRQRGLVHASGKDLSMSGRCLRFFPTSGKWTSRRCDDGDDDDDDDDDVDNYDDDDDDKYDDDDDDGGGGDGDDDDDDDYVDDDDADDDDDDDDGEGDYQGRRLWQQLEGSIEGEFQCKTSIRVNQRYLHFNQVQSGSIIRSSAQ